MESLGNDKCLSGGLSASAIKFVSAETGICEMDGLSGKSPQPPPSLGPKPDGQYQSANDTNYQCQWARKTLANVSPPTTIAASVSRSAQVSSSSRLSLTGHKVARMNPFLLGRSLEADLFTFH